MATQAGDPEKEFNGEVSKRQRHEALSNFPHGMGKSLWQQRNFNLLEQLNRIAEDYIKDNKPGGYRR